MFAQLGRGQGLFSPAQTGHVWPEAKTADRIAIALDGEKTEAELRFRRYHFDLGETRFDDLFHCYASETGRRLRFFAEPEGPTHTGSIPTVYGRWRGGLVFLLKPSDGSHVVHCRIEQVFVTAMLIGTHVDFDSLWWRYPALEDERRPSGQSGP